MSFSCQVCLFAPVALSSFSVRIFDSWKRQHVWRQHFTFISSLVKIHPWNKLMHYSSAVSQQIQSDGWRIDLTAGFTPQGCNFYSHHHPLMVVWTVKVCVLMLGFLIALQRQQCFSYATEILRALHFAKRIRRPFHFLAGITPQDATCISFCPCRNSWMKFQYAVYFISISNWNLQLCPYGAAFFSISSCFCYFPWSEAVRSIRSSPVASTRTENFTRVRTNKIMEIMWLVDCLWNFLFCYVLVFFVCYKNVSFSKWTSEQSNGRQEPLNYHCEGLIVFFSNNSQQ